MRGTVITNILLSPVPQLGSCAGPKVCAAGISDIANIAFGLYNLEIFDL